jgi:hypothetical protein
MFFFSKNTTSEKKFGFLLIEVFRKLFNPQSYGHQGSILGGLSYLSGNLRITNVKSVFDMSELGEEFIGITYLF